MVKRLVFGIVLQSVALLSFVLLINTPAQVEAKQPNGYSLHSVTLDTREYAADGVVRVLTWRNDTGGRLLIRKAYLWMGMYRGALADSDAALTLEDGTTIAKLQWDHYAEPVTPSGVQFDYDAGYIVLEAGAVLRLTYYTTPIVKQADFMAACQAIIWYSEE